MPNHSSAPAILITTAILIKAAVLTGLVYLPATSVTMVVLTSITGNAPTLSDVESVTSVETSSRYVF